MVYVRHTDLKERERETKIAQLHPLDSASQIQFFSPLLSRKPDHCALAFLRILGLTSQVWFWILSPDLEIHVHVRRPDCTASGGSLGEPCFGLRAYPSIKRCELWIYRCRMFQQWRASLICGEFSKCLRAKVCVCMCVLLENMSGGFVRVLKRWNLK